MMKLPAPPATGRRNIIVLFILAATGLLIYAGIFQAPFVFDSQANIPDNPYLRMTEISGPALAGVLKSRPVNRPLAKLSFALNYYVHEYRVAGYHAVNLAVHIITAFLIYLLACRTPGIRTRSDIGRPAGPVLVPLLAALLWLVHPLHIQSVTYTVQRMNSLAAMFYLLSLVCYVEARLTRLQAGSAESGPSPGPGPTGKTGLLYGAAAFSGLLALASKEIAVTLPVMILAYEWIFFQNADRAWLKQRLKWLGGATVIICLIALVYLGVDPVEKIMSGYKQQTFTMGERLLTQPLVLLYYLTLLAFPHPARLNLDYGFPVSRSLIDPAVTVLALMALSALFIVAMVSTRRRPLMAFAMLWFLVTLAVESSFIGLAPVFEHRTYLPSVFLVPAFTVWLTRRIRPRPAAIAVMTGLIIAGGAWTYQRNMIWTDEFTLWQDTVDKSPGLARAHNEFGRVYRTAGDRKTALEYFRKAVSLEPTFYKALINTGEILQNAGRPREAIHFYQRASQLFPTDPIAYNNIGSVLVEQNQFQAGLEYLNQALGLKPDFAEAHLNLGVAMMGLGRNREALASFTRAVQADHLLDKAHNNLGVVLFQMGETDRAAASFQTALKINPDYVSARENLEKIMAGKKQQKENHGQP